MSRESENQGQPQSLPKAQGLYDARNEHDACGIGFVASVRGEKSHDIVLKGIQVLVNLTHRGACGCDPETGDGAGLLIQIPHRFFARECTILGFPLPSSGEYGVGMVFLPVEKYQRLQCEGILERITREEGLSVLGWRDTPVNGDAIGRVARHSQPYIEQIFIARAPGMLEAGVRAQVVRGTQAGRTGNRALGNQRQGDVLSPLALLPHDRLQGIAACDAS